MKTTIPSIIVEELIRAHDVFLVDQYGVLRDDRGAYPDAVATLEAVKAAGKTVVILSNSGRSGDYNIRRFAELGFRRESFDHFVTSGDAAFATLSQPGSPIVPGSKSFTISSGDDFNLSERLGLTVTNDAGLAGLVIISGSQSEHISMDAYRAMLLPAAAAGVPAVCTNPDLFKFVDGQPAPGAGAIARLYGELDGDVCWFGKPSREIYDYAARLYPATAPEKIVCIGDSIENDIKGARAMGFRSVLVRTGVLAAMTEIELEAEMMALGCRPDFIMPRFAAF
jgi:HAD superfamily hydrolase (TIGR01459 family)